MHPVGATRTPRIERQTFNIGNVWMIAHLARRLAPDVVHFTCAHPWNLLIARLLRGIPQVFTIHDVIPHPGEAVSRFVGWYNRDVFGGLADRVIVHGRSHLGLLASMGVDVNRVRYVPLGEFWPPTSHVPVPSDKRVLFFGRIVPYKGLDILAEAANIVRVREPDARFVIAGKGELSRFLGRTNSLGLEVHSRFIGDTEVAGFFHAARVVVLPYTSGTQSGVIPLAYSYRRPVVAT